MIEIPFNITHITTPTTKVVSDFSKFSTAAKNQPRPFLSAVFVDEKIKALSSVLIS